MIETVGVVGCGSAGTGVIEAAARSGFSVVGLRATGGDLEPSRRRLLESLDRRVGRGRMTEEERAVVVSRVRYERDFAALDGCDLVVESALEERDAKSECLKRIEDHISSGAILATNTSSLPLQTLAEELRRPEQFLALHFFHPVPAMKLVEVGATEQTAPGVVATAHQFVRDLGKTAVDVQAIPGYSVNRLLVPYLLHSMETLEQGIGNAPSIDEAMTLGCGHPMGPFALADFIGLDVLLAMARSLHAELKDERYRPPALLESLVEAGEHGRKTLLGFYDYSDSDSVTNPRLPKEQHPLTE